MSSTAAFFLIFFNLPGDADDDADDTDAAGDVDATVEVVFDENGLSCSCLENRGKHNGLRKYRECDTLATLRACRDNILAIQQFSNNRKDGE